MYYFFSFYKIIVDGLIRNLYIKSFKMYDMLISLQECCIDFISDYLQDLCIVSVIENISIKKFVFKDFDIFFYGELFEQLLQIFCEKGKLIDEILSLFDFNVINLKRVFIRDVQFSVKGLRILKSYKIFELEIIGFRIVIVNDVIGCLGEWILFNLKFLNVNNSTFVNSIKFCVVVLLFKLYNFQSLNVSNIEFNKYGFEIIVEDFFCFVNLDIFSIQILDIFFLRKCKDRLKFLFMYNLVVFNQDDVVFVLCELIKLVYLDVSEDFLMQSFVNVNSGKFVIINFFFRFRCFFNFIFLDISGKDGVNEDVFRYVFFSYEIFVLFLFLDFIRY